MKGEMSSYESSVLEQKIAELDQVLQEKMASRVQLNNQLKRLTVSCCIVLISVAQ